MKIFNTKGFLLGEPLDGRASISNQYDGYKLDELVLNASFTSQEDFDYVINYLKMHKHCFDKKEPLIKNTNQ